MSRWVEDAGATAGATVIAAARAEAWRVSFCIATDATGIAVWPGRRPEGKRRACRRGHFFVHIADRDHVFFEYTPKETSISIEEMFRGYSGYIQADAKSVYDVLFREPEKPPEGGSDKRLEVGCWSQYPDNTIIRSRSALSRPTSDCRSEALVITAMATRTPRTRGGLALAARGDETLS
jgi:hypothetical protein